jgi:hypothetical protein
MNAINPYTQFRHIYIKSYRNKKVYGDISLIDKEAAIDYLISSGKGFVREDIASMLICDASPPTREISELLAAGFGVLYAVLTAKEIKTYYFAPSKG